LIEKGDVKVFLFPFSFFVDLFQLNMIEVFHADGKMGRVCWALS